MKVFRPILCLLTVSLPACFAAEWRIDPAHSSAAFAVRHMMISTVRGSFAGVKGTVDYEPANLAAAKVEMTIDATTITTRNDDRDKHLKSAEFFDIAKYPEIKFVSKRIVPQSPGKFQIVGDMTLHGVTKEVTFEAEGPTAPIKDGRGNLHLGANAATKVDRKSFGLVWNKALDGGGVMVGDEVELTVEVEMIQSPKGI